MESNNSKNSFGTAGGVIGIVNASLSVFLVWLMPVVFIVLSAVSIGLSSVALKKANEQGLKKGLAITGLATSIPTLLFAFFWATVWTAALTA